MKATTIRKDDTVLNRVDAMAKSLNRSRAWVINQALERFLSYEEWFVREVEAGLDEARRGELASQEEVAARFAKWGCKCGLDGQAGRLRTWIMQLPISPQIVPPPQKVLPRKFGPARNS